MSRSSTPSDVPAKPVQSTEAADADEFLTGKALILVIAGVLTSVFLIAVDQTIVANSLPFIASKFNALGDLAWIPTAYLLTQAPCLLIYGQLTTLFPTKWVYIFAVALFELGSLLSGLSPSVGFLIFARAFQGLGAAGIFVCAITITAEIIPLRSRPKFFGLFGGLFAVSSIIGPLLGGAFVDHVSWRWCFYINLPLSVPTFWFCLQFIKAKPPRMDIANPPPPLQPGENRFIVGLKRGIRRLGKLDWLGALLVLGSTTCLVLAVQWGGNTKPWNSADVIATFVLFGVLGIAFVGWEHFRGDAALMPLKLLKNRSQVGSCLVAVFTRCAFFIAVFNLPLYFQAVKGHSPVKSGLDLIPLTLAVVFTAAGGGFIISKIGRYWYILIVGPLFGVVGFGLVFTLDETSSWGKIIGYQILMGMGVGSTLQTAIIAVQADIEKELIPQATGLVTFATFIGGILGIAIAGSIFENKLASGLREFAPDAPFDMLRESVEALKLVPPAQRAGAIHAYVLALRAAIGILGVGASALTSVSGLIIRNLDIRKANPRGGADDVVAATPAEQVAEKSNPETVVVADNAAAAA